MTNLFVVFLALLSLIACGGEDRPLRLPQTLPGGWQRGSAPAQPAAPDVVTKLGLKGTQGFVYEGAGRVEVTVFEMTSSSGAFELVQKWRAEPGLSYLQRGAYFVVLRSATLDTKSLLEFTALLEKSM